MALQLEANVKTDDNRNNRQMTKALIVKPSVSSDGSYCTVIKHLMNKVRN